MKIATGEIGRPPWSIEFVATVDTTIGGTIIIEY